MTGGITAAAALAHVKATRLAHFTPAKNLPHILADASILSSKDLADNAPEYFSPTDRERFDRHPDKVCCSFEYPNAYYLRRAQAKPEYRNYPDWVCLLLDITLAERPGALFSPCNAAKNSGAYLRPGGDAILACYAPQVREWERRPGHMPGAPTDLQTEALIPGPIDLSYLRGIVVPSSEAAQNEYGRLLTLGVNPDGLPWLVAPTFFNPDELARRLRFGGTVAEAVWLPPVREGGPA